MAQDLPPIALYSTLTRRVEPLVPKQPGKVGVYCCGPTTYDHAHVGHARAAIAPDLLVRVLRHRGLDVTYVRNITDVDDKILERAQANGEDPTALSARMADSYRADMASIGCERPSREPKVSEHVAEILAMIATLVANGAAYAVAPQAGTGRGSDVYVRVRAFAGYGKLSGRNVDDLRSGARVEVDERKEDPLDFALWKGCDDAAWGWPSPFGRGRPGWHIECSAMATKYLGHGFDVHTGGMDLIFPHHENEIAQSESANPGGGDFARLWLHNGFVNVDKEKMSKSLGNFFTMKDVLERNDPEALRFFLVQFHYRGPVSFDVETLDGGRVVFPGVDEAERQVDYLYITLARIEGLTVSAVGAAQLPKDVAKLADEVTKLRHDAFASLADDLGTAGAVAAALRLAAIVNEAMDLHVRRKADRAALAHLAATAAQALREILDVLGALRTPAARYTERTRARRLSIRGLQPAEVEAKVVARTEARQAKDFTRADSLRLELESIGVELFDDPAGTRWRVKA
ncbi:MAG: cysteine--tRNA ligase [Polyangiales bacterium]